MLLCSSFFVTGRLQTTAENSPVFSQFVCPSVCPSVTLVICDHIGWKYWKLIVRTISPTPSLFIAKRRSTYSRGNVGKFGGD